MNARRIGPGFVLSLFLCLITLLAFERASAKPKATDAASIERGRYVVQMGSCNDCHTPGYPEGGGVMPESEWLKGSPVGFKGPWGTTYPANLRLYMQKYTEDEWVAIARVIQTRPPMPWYEIRRWSEDDARAAYRFIRSLGPAGDPAPDYVPPTSDPTTPYIVFVPQGLPEAAPASK